MKKNYLFFAAALAFVACSNENVKSEIEEKNAPISFESYTNSQTKAENSDASYSWAFFDHHTTFKVWGYKNTAATAVFDGDVVTVSSDDAAAPNYTYTYSPLRYWDKAASTYQFYACAPSDGGFVFVSSNITSADTQNKGYFTNSGVTLAGTNLSAQGTSGTFTYVNSFKAARGDSDLLIAAPKSVAKANFSSAVQLDFIHILSRLNITIKKDNATLGGQNVKLTELTVKNLFSKGDFSEATDANTSGSISRWSNTSTAMTYTAQNPASITTSAQYILQSLVIPQIAEKEVDVALDGTGVGDSSKPYLYLKYTIGPDNDAETFESYYNLALLFADADLAFNEGWQNTLNITIKPNVIEFTGMVAEWSSTNDKDVDL